MPEAPPFPSNDSSEPKPSDAGAKNPTVSVASFLQAKDQYDREIASLATDINAHLKSNAGFQNARGFIDRAADISRRIHETRDEVAAANMKEKAAQGKLVEVLDAEIGRIDGLLNGMRESAKGGDWRPGFQQGTASAYRYDDVNAELQKLLQ